MLEAVSQKGGIDFLGGFGLDFLNHRSLQRGKKRKANIWTLKMAKKSGRPGSFRSASSGSLQEAGCPAQEAADLRFLLDIADCHEAIFGLLSEKWRSNADLAIKTAKNYAVTVAQNLGEPLKLHPQVVVACIEGEVGTGSSRNRYPCWVFRDLDERWFEKITSEENAKSQYREGLEAVLLAAIKTPSSARVSHARKV